MSALAFNPPPKARFLAETGNVIRHKNMVQEPAFERGTDAAMLQYQAAVAGQVASGNDAMAAGFKLLGALEYLATLKTLAETQTAPKPTVTGQLDHKV